MRSARHLLSFWLPTCLQGPRSFFSEIISSINDIKFSPCGRYILSRDYMALKLWDINMDSGPLASYPVHESLRGRVRARGLDKGVGRRMAGGGSGRRQWTAAANSVSVEQSFAFRASSRSSSIARVGTMVQDWRHRGGRASLLHPLAMPPAHLSAACSYHSRPFACPCPLPPAAVRPVRE